MIKQRQMGTWLPLLIACSLAATACATVPAPITQTPPAAGVAAAPTVEEAIRFTEEAERRLSALAHASAQAEWVLANFITVDTQAIAARAGEQYTAAAVELATQAARFDHLELPYETARQLELLKLFLTAPAPSDPDKTRELSTILSRLGAMYGEGQWCPTPDNCLNIGDITRIIATSRDPEELRRTWAGWRTISIPMRPLYERFVQLTNEGAQELGYADTGQMWRSKYDMPPDEFTVEIDRLWEQVKPLYDSLHCYVRWKLSEHYGPELVPLDQPIRADLLGNIWAQDWSNVYDLVAPPPELDSSVDLTALLQQHNYDPLEMVRSGERFFTSLGLDPLPETFWARSLFVKPRDREVVCHASAWNLDDVEDLRIKMCIEVNAEDFQTIHHELGHSFYQRAYNQLPYLFRSSANDGFHEALGDTISLSVTPAYLVKIGLLDREPPTTGDIGMLMRDALSSIAFLPFGLLVDQWRWRVFSGELTPATYNAGWWQLRERYQGVRAPMPRSEADFDPGAKYHIPGNTPYTRYFLARILQFQFHRALCETAGYSGPLNRCTIYGSEAAGERLNRMMELGQSRPWPDALEVLTGQREMDATAIIDYFAPLGSWLDQQNAGRRCGW
jgi:peptidyl-dipeptidase A